MNIELLADTEKIKKKLEKFISRQKDSDSKDNQIFKNLLAEIKKIEKCLNKNNIYTVIRFYNYRKQINFETLNSFFDLEEANEQAYKYALQEYKEEEIVDDVENCYLYGDYIYTYTIGDGDGQNVYAVIQVPNPY